MGFVVGLPKTKRYFDSTCVTIGRMKNSAHLLLIKMIYVTKDCVKLYIHEFFILHGVSLTNISDHAVTLHF